MLQWFKNFRPTQFVERIRQVLVLGEFRGGKLIGIDKSGNKYYEVVEQSKMLPFRNRYVEYAAGRRKDASQIPSEWHGWLHSITDEPPTSVEYSHSIAETGHSENFTGTAAKYAPYNTTKPKIIEYNTGKSAILAEKVKSIEAKK